MNLFSQYRDQLTKRRAKNPGKRCTLKNRSSGFEPLEYRLLLSTTYYIATTGNDQSGDGSAAHPFLTIQHGANLAQPGDTVDVKPGQYAGFILGWDFPQGGTAGAPITYQGETGATITSRDNKTPDGIDLEPGCPYVNIYGFTVNNGDGSITRGGIRVAGSDHVNIVGNTCDHNGDWGIFTSFSNYTLILNNVASNSTVQHGIYVSNSPDHVSVIGNTVFGNANGGIQFNGDLSQGGTGLATNELVENNIIYSNGRLGGGAINCDGLQNSVIENNLLYNNHSSGITLFQQDGATGAMNNLVVNNTIVMASDSRWAININTGSTGNVLFNNILFNENGSHGDIFIDSSSLPGFKSDYNVLAGRENVDDDSTFESLSAWRTQTSQDMHSIQSTEAAVFANPAGGNYQLASNSPALKAGVSTFAGYSAPTTDIQGNTRPTGVGVDIGAYNLSTISAPMASNQSVTTNQNTAVGITLTGSDPNTPPKPLTFIVTANPAHGTLSGIAPNLIYTPTAGYFGADSFHFKDNNGALDSNVATVSITVNQAGAPTANSQSVTTKQNAPVSITLTGSDSNSPPRSLTYIVTANPSHGVLTGTAPNLTYTPTAGYVGADSFQFKDNNGTLDSNVATVSIAVSASKADLAVFRSSTGQAFVMPAAPAFPYLTSTAGQAGDIPLQGDFDGDGKTDIAVYRPSTATWYIYRSQLGFEQVQFGQANVDIPVVGDYDHDGKTDLAVYRPTTNTWYILGSAGTPIVKVFGQAGDIPAPGAYDGKLTTEIAVYRPSTAQFVINGPGNVSRTVTVGTPGGKNVPIPADFDGIGKDEPAVYQPATATWLINNPNTGTTRVIPSFGVPNTDIPVPRDYDGDGKADLAVFRPSNGTWYILYSGGGARVQQFGATTDIPMPEPLSYLTASIGSKSQAQGFGGPGVFRASAFDFGRQAASLGGGSTPGSVLVVIPGTAHRRRVNVAHRASQRLADVQKHVPANPPDGALAAVLGSLGRIKLGRFLPSP